MVVTPMKGRFHFGKSSFWNRENLDILNEYIVKQINHLLCEGGEIAFACNEKPLMLKLFWFAIYIKTQESAEDYEIEAQVNLDMCVFMQTELEVVTDMKIEPIDYEKKSHMPGIVGYIVQPEDTLWSIARKYYATTESIRKLNHLEDDTVREGDRLIIVKS